MLSVALAAPTVVTVVPNAPRPQILTAQGILAAYPILKRIAACESTGSVENEPRQFLPDGSPLWGIDHGVIVKRDVGLFQINLKAHAEELANLHLDVVTKIDDNANYALILFERNGTRDWLPSKSCWNKN